MNKTNAARIHRSALLFFGFIGLCLLFVGSMLAESAGQEIGLKDVAYSSLTRVECQGCHGENLVDTHHDTRMAVSGDCALCHTVSTQPGSIGVALERNCMICHEESPHHVTEAANNKECGSCHESAGVSDWNTEAPPYGISKVTPTTETCKKCHMASDESAELKIAGIKDTHHGISLKDCNACHEEENRETTSIRICERCHSVKAIHEVLAHVEKENCKVCHVK